MWYIHLITSIVNVSNSQIILDWVSKQSCHFQILKSKIKNDESFLWLIIMLYEGSTYPTYSCWKRDSYKSVGIINTKYKMESTKVKENFLQNVKV